MGNSIIRYVIKYYLHGRPDIAQGINTTGGSGGYFATEAEAQEHLKKMNINPLFKYRVEMVDAPIKH
jgi:hypothetical protein